MNAGIIALLFVLAALLLGAAGLFAASDAAIAARSRAELLALADEVPRSSAAIRAIAEDEEAHINALSFTRVVAEALSAVLITVAFSMIVPGIWWTLLCATLVVAGMTFVLVGSSPRAVGARHSVQVIRIAAPIVRAVRVVLGPIATGLMRFGNRVTPGRHSRGIQGEHQLLSLVDQAAEQFLLEQDDRDYIHSLVEFGDTLVREVMVPRIDMVTVDADKTVRAAFELLLSSRHSRLPVVSGEADEVEGVIYLRDVSRFALHRPEEAEGEPIRRLMKDAIFVPELQRADDLLRQMQREANHLALVVDEYGGISGLVTLEDLIEELLGEILDEHDRESPEVVLEQDGSVQVSARLPVDRLGELFGVELEDDDVDSVGGLVSKLLGRLADEGDRVVVAGIELTALRTERRRQRLVLVGARWLGEKTADPDGAGDAAERAESGRES